jgi:nicotinate-nucleotide pyrophosphorylase (carboxylating)
VSFDPPASAVHAAVAAALAEDLLPLGDLTASLLPEGASGKGRFVSREAGVIAGTACVTATFAQLDPAIELRWSARDGAAVEAGQEIAAVTGPLAPVLTGERTALNFIRHLSGVATITSRFATRAADASGGHTRIIDTR